MTKHLPTGLLSLFVAALAGGVAGGCQQTKPKPPVSIEINSFAETWTSAPILDRGEKFDELYVRDEQVIAYTNRRRMIALSSAGGKVLYYATLSRDHQEILHSPLVIAKNVIVTTGSTIEVFDKAGNKLRSIDTEHAVKSAAAGEGDKVFVGLDYPRFARLAKYDVTNAYRPIAWELLFAGSVASTPIYYQKTLYAADTSGLVYAVNDERNGVWPLPGSAFKTDRAVMADLKADDYGVYVASTDQRLYCLDRSTGKLKWQYLAGSILTEPPFVTADTVYQPMPGGRLAAINKTNGTPNRGTKWVADNVSQVLGEDAMFVYVATPKKVVAALDKATGTLKFVSKRKDFVKFASNPRDTTVYALTASGKILAFKPVLKPGTVGVIVRADTAEFEPVAAAN